MLTPSNSWRLVLSDAADGATNMGLDEAILERVTQGESPPTLRLYRWNPPALSLGYAQPAADVDLEALQARHWSLVRRPTGGRAILHTDELTYALIASADNPHVAGGVLASYQHLSQGLRCALQSLGLDVELRSGESISATDRSNPVCFEVPSAYEVLVGGKKIIGSAQLRRRGGVLQHGTFPLTGDIGRICDGLHFADAAARADARKRLSARATTASELLERELDWEEAALAFRRGFERELGIQFKTADLTADEQQRAQELAERHRSEGWLYRL